MDPKEREQIVRAKMAVGLSRAQAESVIDAQEAWDNDPANPANEKTSEPAETQSGEAPAKLTTKSRKADKADA